jgi:hypothetical protein
MPQKDYHHNLHLPLDSYCLYIIFENIHELRTQINWGLFEILGNDWNSTPLCKDAFRSVFILYVYEIDPLFHSNEESETFHISLKTILFQLIDNINCFSFGSFMSIQHYNSISLSFGKVFLPEWRRS